jgi:hypothetical protein
MEEGWRYVWDLLKRDVLETANREIGVPRRGGELWKRAGDMYGIC